ncbi:DNA topoisomerase IV, alpha subunit [Durotheca rogersii]|uniref:DNA topoisomerase IV, alpha subunit n=1 Tax=Durotheca rogersii TaxID=419775 RepID=UPI00221FA836|nr:DNA topoisomerase IV, alpha subunit [Durotheca rogersii]KAI5859521.1 DNA topoisomerase IV, alpha subunit [Durotheca rogersii]
MERPVDSPVSSPNSESPPPEGMGVSVGGAARSSQTGTVVSRIEDILEHIVDALSENRVLAIPLRSRRTRREKTIRFPANTEAEVKRFTCALQVLHACHEALTSGRIVTKRNIYYQNPDLFGSQRYVDNLIDDIAFTFGVGRDALNVVAASKGLIAGRISLVLTDGSTLDGSCDGGNGILIPHIGTIREITMSQAKWIIIVEKEATFRELAASQYFDTSVAGRGVIVTAKGFPDLLTRQFLSLLHSYFPQIPFYALVDFDPSGIGILLTYKLGSRSLGHEDDVVVPRLSWLGPNSNDLKHGQIHSASNPSSPVSGFPPKPFQLSTALTLSDRRQALCLLAKFDDRNTEEMDLTHEIQLMLVLNLKAEIQAVDDAGDMGAWLDDRLLSHLGAG